MDYYNYKALSNTLLGKIYWYIKKGLPFDSFHFKEESSEFMVRGTHVHKAMEDLSYLDRLKYYDRSFIQNSEGKNLLTPHEMKIVEEGSFEVAYYCNVYNNKITKAARNGDEKAINEIEIHLNRVAEISELWRDHVKDVNSEGNIILDDIYGSKAKSEYYTIKNCYEALINNKELKEILNSSQTVEREKIIQWECKGYPCKSMLDIITDDWIIDIKTFSKGSIYSSILTRDYCRQLSFYQEATDSNRRVGILGVNTSDYSTEFIEISQESLLKGKTGGYKKLSWMTFNDGNFYMNPKQIESLNTLGFWNTNDYQSEKWCSGWEEIIEYIDQHNLYQKLWQYQHQEEVS